MVISFPGSVEHYLPPRIFDKAVAKQDIRTRMKAPLKIDKETFEVPDNPKCPKTSFIAGYLTKFHFFTRQDLIDKKIELERDKGNVAPASKKPQEDEEDDSETDDDEE